MITQKQLKEWLEYNPATGDFVWLKKPAKQIAIGTTAGCVTAADAYIKIRILGNLYHAHRLAFLYMVGSIPEQIDHDDRNGQNNVWANLNASSQKHNKKNVSKRTDNTSGYTGVGWDAKRNQWSARINLNGSTKFLGRFTDKADAIAARQAADIKYDFHPNHGK